MSTDSAKVSVEAVEAAHRLSESGGAVERHSITTGAIAVLAALALYGGSVQSSTPPLQLHALLPDMFRPV